MLDGSPKATESPRVEESTMETQYQKWVNLSYLAVAGLLGYIVFTGGIQIAGAYDLEARVRNIDLMIRGIALLLGAILFFGLYRSDRANQFMNEVASELMRVTWPTHKETLSSTYVVIIMVVISGMLLGLMDYVWTALLKMVL
jgi:preprotein translocase subunit SecE